jgi:hypothetical protein
VLSLHLSRLTLHITTYRWQSLLGLGGLSALVYGLCLVWPYNIFTLKLAPLLHVGKLTRGQPLAQADYVLAFAAASGVYYLMWRVCRGSQPRSVWLVLIGIMVGLNALMLWLYPIGAADIFDNIVRGRITAVHGGNPFYDTPSEFKADLFFPYAAWRNATSAYGPLWEMLAASLAWLMGTHKIGLVLAFKLAGLMFYGGCVWLIAQCLQKLAPERAAQGVVLFALNPLVIYETAGNGHNDVALAFFVLLAVRLMVDRRFTWAALALTGGALIKFIPILLLPVALAAGVRPLPTWPARLRFWLFTALACAGLVVAAYAPFWRGEGDVLSLTRRAGLFTTSLPALAQVHLANLLGLTDSQLIVSRWALALTGVFVVVAAWRVWHEPTAVIHALAQIITYYLLFTCLWFQPWYTIWPLALTALLPEGAFSRLIVLFSYSALWKSILFDFVIFTGSVLPPLIWRETLLAPLILGLPWLYVLYLRLRKPNAVKSQQPVTSKL